MMSYCSRREMRGGSSGHGTVFEVECIDRMYCNVHVPQLQHTGGLLGYIQRQLGLPIASTAPLGKITDAFAAAMHPSPATSTCRGRTSARASARTTSCTTTSPRSTGTEGVLFIGRAQEKTQLFRTERRRDAHGESYPWMIHICKEGVRAAEHVAVARGVPDPCPYGGARRLGTRRRAAVAENDISGRSEVAAGSVRRSTYSRRSSTRNPGRGVAIVVARLPDGLPVPNDTLAGSASCRSRSRRRRALRLIDLSPWNLTGSVTDGPGNVY
jgi:hypothetical protein